MGVDYITNLCKGTFGDLNVSTVTKKIKLSDDKMVEQHEWNRKFVDLKDLKAVCNKNNIDISDFLDDDSDIFLEEVGCSTMGMDPCYWSNFIKVKDCFCNDATKMHTIPCVICKNEVEQVMDVLEREWQCCKKITAICGLPEFVCESCE